MHATEETTDNLESLLDKLQTAAREAGETLSAGELIEAVGRRSFGPVLLISGLLGMTPVSAIPTAPTILAIINILIAGQLLVGRDSIWLPRWLSKLSVDSGKVEKAVEVARKPARFVDKLVRPRLRVFTGGVADRFVAAACVIVAMATPPLELLPFMTFFPAFSITIFGLALISRDGLLVLIALTISGGALGFGAWHLLT